MTGRIPAPVRRSIAVAGGSFFVALALLLNALLWLNATSLRGTVKHIWNSAKNLQNNLLVGRLLLIERLKCINAFVELLTLFFRCTHNVPLKLFPAECQGFCVCCVIAWSMRVACNIINKIFT